MVNTFVHAQPRGLRIALRQEERIAGGLIVIFGGEGCTELVLHKVLSDKERIYSRKATTYESISLFGTQLFQGLQTDSGIVGAVPSGVLAVIHHNTDGRAKRSIVLNA